MFRATSCSSSGGPIVSPQPLVSSPSVSSSKHVEECSVTYILLKIKRICTKLVFLKVYTMMHCQKTSNYIITVLPYSFLNPIYYITAFVFSRLHLRARLIIYTRYTSNTNIRSQKPLLFQLLECSVCYDKNLFFSGPISL